MSINDMGDAPHIPTDFAPLPDEPFDPKATPAERADRDAPYDVPSFLMAAMAVALVVICAVGMLTLYAEFLSVIFKVK